MPDDAPQQPGRAASPGDWAALGSDQVPGLDSSSSVVSSSSSVASQWSSSSGATFPQRRGYVRPTGTDFTRSTRNRESVTSLGDITHLQHYFARTGLLDDKGGRVAKESLRPQGAINGINTSADRARDCTRQPSYDGGRLTPCTAASEDGDLSESALESPTAFAMDANGGLEHPPTLPPTVSTYKRKVYDASPPPDMAVLRKGVRGALSSVHGALADIEKEAKMEPRQAEQMEKLANLVYTYVETAVAAFQSLLTRHDQPERLDGICGERTVVTKEIRNIRAVVRGIRKRKFKDGVQEHERQDIAGWANAVGRLVDGDEEQEEKDMLERESKALLFDDWKGSERERGWRFLTSFDDRVKDVLPPWTDPDEASELPTPFLAALRNGLTLIHLHNTIVQQSRLQIEVIRSHHRDPLLPYGRKKNLELWLAAAARQWDTVLELNVTALEPGTNANAWRSFDEAVLKWSTAVRKAITTEWTQARRNKQTLHPTHEILDVAQKSRSP